VCGVSRRVFLKVSLVFALMVFFMVSARVWARPAVFESDTFPGEGVPVLSAREDSLRLYAEPSLDSPVRRLPFQKGWKVVYDTSKQITIQSVLLRVTSTVTDGWCQGGKFEPLHPGETVEYLQYRAEGYGTMRVRGMICEVFIMDNEARFDGMDKEPEVQWWVRVVDGEGRGEGWLLVDGSQAEILGREF
jgi:hypothetical protein